MSFTRRLIYAVLLLLAIASCSGGGCGGGCSACGTQPLPGGFPKPETIPNAASVRVTRPGLDFVQENLGNLASKALGTSVKNGIAAFAIPSSTSSGVELCSVATPTASQCIAEADIDSADPTKAMRLRVDAITPSSVKIDGKVRLRVRDLPVKFGGFYNAYVVVGDAAQAPGNDLCAGALRGSADFPYLDMPVNVELPLVTETRVPRDGYTKVDVDNAVIDLGLVKDDVGICDDTCGGFSFCQSFLDGVKDFAFSTIKNTVVGQIKDALSASFCTVPLPNVTPPCPNGSEPDDPDLTKAKRCEFIGTNECVPSLLGTDGRMDLSQALAKFSPGTTGGLDFVLASAGNMNPAPGDATLPAWTPRKPPVPAEDNNKNGVSLAMLGGALPQPTTKCVEIVHRDPPKDIPVPKELTTDNGTHLEVALAGRYMDHALLGAYNSGALCLSITTDAVAQLNSGYLSVLAPSIKDLTFENENAGGAVSTRPGVPPKIKIGAAPDPLLTLTLEKFAVDFYVFSYDRYVRIFTYTADVTVPIDLQTSKAGIQPVIGKLGVANAHVDNDKLLYEDEKRISDGVSQLLGGIVGQFLGNGISPIDLSSALASAGLGLDIPDNGIRKLTSGTDDFVGVFANLKVASTAAHEEADTRAAIVEKIVDPSVMALATADRARSPKLRVRVDTVASRPTEHTWWIDHGSRAKWTTDRDVVVDQDAMFLQGKHVLHVVSRIVGETGSEDATPVDLPFVIDTLPPTIEAKLDGDHYSVDVWDFVSAKDAISVRWDGGQWQPATDVRVPADATEIEAKDEEGNLGRVSLALRGRADPSLAATGSGCGCKTTSSGGFPSEIVLGVVALALVRRRRTG